MSALNKSGSKMALPDEIHHFVLFLSRNKRPQVVVINFTIASLEE